MDQSELDRIAGQLQRDHSPVALSLASDYLHIHGSICFRMVGQNPLIHASMHDGLNAAWSLLIEKSRLDLREFNNACKALEAANQTVHTLLAADSCSTVELSSVPLPPAALGKKG